ncbi:stabilin-1 isoform X3 [Ascaphus truei]|uniref:stabilin-1 isoform X3 n=1 Tax=Ascaphus truei TaxID=8439 RepID=UPI003F5A91A9
MLSFGFLLALSIAYFTSITAGQPRLLPKQRRCDVRTMLKIATECTSCAAATKVICPKGTTKMTSGIGNRGCSYTVDMGGVTLSLLGCNHICQNVIVQPGCCEGSWGLSCTECPGGSEMPCSGHGTCLDGIKGNGTCICDDGFTGYSCQDCADEYLFGPNCVSACECEHGICNNGNTGDGSCICEAGYTGSKCDQESLSCKALNCGENSRCLDSLDGNVKCECMPGYSKKDNNCQAQDPCKVSPCSRFATCAVLGPRQYKCTCKPDYYGDGKTCLPFNPCSINNGGCFENSTQCVYRSPGKSYCSCKPGMISRAIPAGCYLPSVCRPHICDKSAQCESSAAGTPICVCQDGEIGDGRSCYGSNLNQIQKLNIEGTQMRKLTGALRIFEEGCALTLRKYGPYTVFVPSIKSFKINEIIAKDLCKVHIVPGQHLAIDLLQKSKLWTLSGEILEFSNKDFIAKSRPDVIYTLLKMDLPASNGIIHIIDKLITNDKKETLGNQQTTIGDILTKSEQFSRFETMLENCGLPPILNGPGSFTVFVPSNKAVDALRDGRLIYLLTKAKHKLLELVKYHIYSMAALTIDKLGTMTQILTSANQIMNINITANGKILLGESGIPLDQSDIIASNGIIHTLDGILIPSNIMPILPYRCNETRHEIIKGTCSSCDSILPCSDNSLDLGTVDRECTHGDTINSSLGCARYCNKTITEPGCCKGFFGPDCKSCPAGFSDPCYGRGICNDGIQGNGKCTCFVKYKGIACHICSNPNKHGKDCEEDCKCVHGLCDNRPGSRGVCQGGRCKEGYTGEFCDRRSEPCGPLNISQYCHLNSVCETTDNITRCACSNGYEGDGFSCQPIDICKKPDRGGCSENAICISISPGNVTCQCNPGWTGDGIACLAIDNCVLKNRGGCHINADCNFVQPGENDCTCKRGYVGDGYLCDPVDPCLENNGGCHDMAKCKSVTGGERTCTCPEQFAGDGLICYGDILMELERNPDLAIFNLWIKNSHFTISKGINVTALIPSDAVIASVPEEEKTFWLDPYMLPFLIRAHFLRGNFNFGQLEQYDGQELSTLDPRTKWELTNTNGSIKIHNASVVISDIPAVNGIIFIINKVLMPPLGNIPPARPRLAQQLDLVPMFDKFKKALQGSGLLQDIESSEQKYTIFVPGNTAVVKFCNDSDIDQIDNDTLKYHIILGVKLSPADLLNGIHKSSMLGPSYWLMFYEKNNQTFVHDVPLDGTFFETKNGMLMGISRVLQILKNRCDTNLSIIKKTKCTNCLRGIQCPSGTDLEEPRGRKREPDCTFKRRNRDTKGCTFNCTSSSVLPECCKGYFGHQCLMCQGGPGNWCSNNGDCQDGSAGSGECICKEGFHGTACETCEPGRFGTDCKSECECVHGRCNDGLYGDGYCQCDKGWSSYTCERDIKKDLCNDTCSLYANCFVRTTNSTPTCSCIAGFTGNGTYCSEVNVCDVSNGGCSKYANCTRVTAGERTCTCMEGYTGDGIVCIEIDACLEYNGGCNSKAECTKTGPNKVACNCLPGYEGNGIDTCTSINICRENNGGCSPFARCINTGPAQHICLCKEDFIGNGITCMGKIVQELSHNPEAILFYKNLQAQSIKDLTGEGPFTLFVPHQHAILNSTTLEEWKNKSLIQDLLRYHLVGCQQLLISDLSEQTSLTTLSGGKIRISSNEDGVYLNDFAKIIRSDIVTRNGVIHFIDKILVPENKNNISTFIGTSELDIIEASQIYGYSMFSKLLKDSNLLSLVSDTIHQPFTMLWPTDEAFSFLPEERKRWLYHEDHRDKLVAYLKVHMIRNTKIIAANLPHVSSLRTMHGSTITFKCSRSSIGDIMVDENNARIVQRHMEFNSGIAHGIDQLLEPPNIGARCDEFISEDKETDSLQTFSRTCSPCGFERPCPLGTVDRGDIRKCSIPFTLFPRRRFMFHRPRFDTSHFVGNYWNERAQSEGCIRRCFSINWVPKCCKNHYGKDCQVCPGGLEAPCSNYGICTDGIGGTGHCSCSGGFNGTACELCSPDRYGSSCKVCNCTENGKCNDGISGDGLCFCNEGWTGQSCEIQLEVNPVCSPACDGNATCRADNICECNPYYDGDGRTCTVIDRCHDANGGCSEHASCTQTGVDVSCNCFPDYDGDGYICNPIDLCANGRNGGCSEHATCINIGPIVNSTYPLHAHE